jgi:phosphopantothenoylcysteine decarboxylase/phosphopantothenate--cysteine ligase
MSPRPLRLLISAGPTREPIDPVRVLSNRSTGFMGACLVAEAIKRGHRVLVVSGPTTESVPDGVRVIWVEQARQMQGALRRHLPKADVLIMAAAVADFEPVRPLRTKVPRRGRWRLVLKPTSDILTHLPRQPGQLFIGFAVEDAGATRRAREKLQEKRLDFLVGQQLNGTGAPFGHRASKAFFLDASGTLTRLGRITKPRLARKLLDEIERLWYRQQLEGSRRPKKA